MSSQVHARTKRVLIAAPRGFCAGVDRAVAAVEVALRRFGEPVYVRHEIVHNKYVVESLRRRGAIFVDDCDEIPEGSVVVFSAHGVAPSVRADAERRSLNVIDATCPLVTKVHKEVQRFAEQDYDIVLIGHAEHEEVVGTRGEAPRHVQVVDGPQTMDELRIRDPERTVWLSQTTLAVDETMSTVEQLRGRLPGLQDPPSDDICYATQNRQVAVRAIAADADLVLVVGSANSSNSLRLVDVARDAGAGRVHRIDDASEFEAAWLVGVETVGVTSGASVPEVLVEQVLACLAAHGFADVEQVELADETLSFALPRPLRA